MEVLKFNICYVKSSSQSQNLIVSHEINSSLSNKGGKRNCCSHEQFDKFNARECKKQFTPKLLI